jgi:hypothetical protein
MNPRKITRKDDDWLPPAAYLAANNGGTMKRIVLIFGLISGAIIAAMIMVPLFMNDTIDHDHSLVFGYTVMVLSFLLVFFGIRSYRENVSGGTITFGRAFKVGILITLMACAVYVATWEIVYFNFLPDFQDKYAAVMIEKARKDGASDAEIAKIAQQMADFKQMYKNPLINIGMTFMEIFPVGLIVTLVSAAILRKRTTTAPPAVEAPA